MKYIKLIKLRNITIKITEDGEEQIIIHEENYKTKQKGNEK